MKRNGGPLVGSEPFPSTEPQEPVYSDIQSEPIIEPINGSYNNLDPVFSYKSGEFNLSYKNLLPFVVAYIIYKWC